MTQILATLPQLFGDQSAAAVLVRRLEAGAVLAGRVLRIGPQGNTPIQIGNSVLTVTLPQTLPPGTTVAVYTQDGKTYVQPQTGSPETAPLPQPQTPQVPTPTPPQAAKASPPLAQLLTSVLQFHNLPANLEGIQVLQAALGNIPPEQAPILALMLARGVPITPENLAQVRERLRSRGNLGKELGRLVVEIQDFLSGGQVRGSESLADILVRIQALLSWDQSGDLEERISRLKDFLQTFEQKLLGRGPSSVQNDLKAMLFELEFLLQQAELPTEHPLRAATRKVLHLLEGAQLSGLTQTVTPDQEAWVFWRLPFPGDPEPTMVEIAIRGDRDPRHPEQYDLSDLEVLIQVELSKLGPVRARIRSQTGQLTVEFTVAEKHHHDYLSKELPILMLTLEQAGFANIKTDVRIESIGSSTLADDLDPIRDLERSLQEVPSQLDLRL